MVCVCGHDFDSHVRAGLGSICLEWECGCRGWVKLIENEEGQ
jgi:hypothetical protein